MSVRGPRRERRARGARAWAAKTDRGGTCAGPVAHAGQKKLERPRGGDPREVRRRLGDGEHARGGRRRGPSAVQQRPGDQRVSHAPHLRQRPVIGTGAEPVDVTGRAMPGASRSGVGTRCCARSPRAPCAARRRSARAARRASATVRSRRSPSRSAPRRPRGPSSRPGTPPWSSRGRGDAFSAAVSRIDAPRLRFGVPDAARRSLPIEGETHAGDDRRRRAACPTRASTHRAANPPSVAQPLRAGTSSSAGR